MAAGARQSCDRLAVAAVADSANEREVARIVASAAHVARVSELTQRIAAVTMEPRGGTATHDPTTDSYTMRVCSQSAISLRGALAGAMAIEPGKLRVVTEDVGGAFGMKSPVYPEYPRCWWPPGCSAGRSTGWRTAPNPSSPTTRPATCSPTASWRSTTRASSWPAAFLRVNLGAYVGFVECNLATNNFARCFPAMYRIPAIDVRVRCAFTNTVPTAPYRGAGRPEAKLSARAPGRGGRRGSTGMAPDRLRKRNLIPPSAIPYKTPVGTTYDSGDFPAVFDKAFAACGACGVSQAPREAASAAGCAAIGISCFLEHSGGMPTEGAGLAFPGGGMVELQLGSQSTGQATPPCSRASPRNSSASRPIRWCCARATARSAS